MPPDGPSPRRLRRWTAQERAEGLCDPGSFAREGEALAGLDPGAPPGDGLVAGFGRVEGRRVLVLAHDGRVGRGAVGARAAGHAAELVRRATAAGAPLVWLLDADGARAHEGAAAVLANAELLGAVASAGGRIPRLAATLGLAGGVAAYGLALCDLTVGLADRSFVFVAGPAVVQAATGEQAALDELGGTRLHARVGTLHATVGHDGEALAWLRTALGYLGGPAPAQPPARPGPLALPPPHRPYDVRELLAQVLDGPSWFPLSEGFGGSTLTGFGRLGGRAIGVVASQPRVLGGALDAEAAQKVARFVRLCAAHGLPVLSFCDTPGFLPGRRQEAARVLVHGADLIAAYAQARERVPVLAVVLRRAVGAGAVLALGAERVLALPEAHLVQMGPQAARAAYGEPIPQEGGALVRVGPDAVRTTLRAHLDAGAPA